MNTDHYLKTGRAAQKNERKRGSALITSVLFSFVVAALGVSFLKLATYEHSSAVRSALYSSSLNLAESGVEFAVEALASGSVNSSTWSKEVKSFLVDRGMIGDVRVLIYNATSVAPVIYAEGIVKGHPDGDVRKQVRVTLSSGLAPFTNGFSARNGITFSGNNVLLDSYNSNYGEYGAFLGIFGPQPRGYGYLGTNRNDDIFVSSDVVNAVGETAIDQGNADVYGYVTVSPGNTVSIGPNGVVTTYDKGSHDSARVLSDFYADFPPEPQPTSSFDNSYSRINKSTTINGSSSKTAPTYYSVDDISLSGRGSDLVINGHVVLLMNGDISVTGKGGITIN